MKLNETTDFSNIRVQCLGKEYPATEAAWKCLEEVKAMREERTNSQQPFDDRERAFHGVENRYVNEAERKAKFNAVSTMLVGFTISDNQESETPQQRLARFKSDLRKEDASSASFRETVKVIKGWLTW
jgi:hypothetical protein